MKSSIRDKAEGMFHEVKGKVKEVAGELSDNPKLEAEGTDEKIAGKVQEECPRAPRFGCMIHHNQNSERHEVVGVKESKK